MVHGVGINNLHGYSCNAKVSGRKNARIYTIWRNMLRACYSKERSKCTMEPNWLILSNFVDDLPKIPCYKEWLEDDSYVFSKWRNGYSHHYSLDTVEFLPKSFVGELISEHQYRERMLLVNEK